MSTPTIEIGKNNEVGFSLNPEHICRIGNRTVQKVIRLGDGFVAFLMNAIEDDESSIDNSHFQSTVLDIRGFLDEHDFKTVPIESLDLIEERLKVHMVKTVDMVIPFRKPPSRGHYLKYNSNRRKYEKKELAIKQLHIQGDTFAFVAMDPQWEYAR